MVIEGGDRMEDFTKLAEAAAPLAQLLKDKYHPHCTAVVDSLGVKIVEDIIFVPKENGQPND